MPILEFSNLVLSGNMIVESPKEVPQFSVSEVERINSNGRAFGFSSDSSNTTSVIGAYASALVSIYEYNGTNWIKQLDLTRSGRFGYKVAIDGDWIAVSDAPASGNGSVFMYHRVNGSWTNTPAQTITIPAGVTGSGFSSAVAMHNGTLVVGHRQASQVGGVHVYVLDGTTWVRQGNLITVPLAEARAGANQNIGAEVSIHNDVIVAGGPGDTLGRGSGIAMLTRRTGTTWSTPVTVRPSTTFADGFGWSVRVKGDSILIGAPFGNASERFPGRAFLYNFATATPVLEQTFTVKTDTSEIIQDTSMTTNDVYGWGLDISDDEQFIAVGSINRVSNRGIVYAYAKSAGTWGQSAMPNSWILPVTPANNSRFGSSILFNNGGLLIGAYGINAMYWFD